MPFSQQANPGSDEHPILDSDPTQIQKTQSKFDEDVFPDGGVLSIAAVRAGASG